LGARQSTVADPHPSRETGESETLLDTSDTLTNAADIDFVPEKGLLLVPTFFGNRLAAYRVAR